jgi:hypothetical protein
MITELYIVTDPTNDAIIMIAPMKTLVAAFDLRNGAVERIRTETGDNGICDVHFNYGRTKLGFAKVNVEAASIATDLLVRTGRL